MSILVLNTYGKSLFLQHLHGGTFYITPTILATEGNTEILLLSWDITSMYV